MPHAKTIRSAPDGIVMPDYIRAALGNRDRYIRDHGFQESDLRIDWWNDELATAAPGRFKVSVDPTGAGSTKLTRGDLFALASRLSPYAGPADAGMEQDDADAYLNFLWHVLIWGSGSSTRNNRKRIASFVDADHGSSRVVLLATAAAAAQAGGSESARQAYGSLIRNGGGVVPGFGPAFFTKFLYFVGQGAAGHHSLILDARVASSLFDAGWTTLPRQRSRGGWSYSRNWYTDTYASYCGLLTRWAEEMSTELGAPIAPDEIERALFEGPART